MKDEVSVVFCRNKKIGSLLIRLFTWSRWSHCAIINDQSVIEARMPLGVVVRPLSDFIKDYSSYEVVKFKVESKSKVISAALSQKGKPYDYMAIIGILFKRDWQNKSKWFCSELVAWALSQGGRHLFRKERLNRATPEHIWMLAED